MGGYGQGASAALGERRRTRRHPARQRPHRRRRAHRRAVDDDDADRGRRRDARAGPRARRGGRGRGAARGARRATPRRRSPRSCARRPVPLVADIHFDYRLALAALEAGMQGIRLNPGNIGARERVREVVKAAPRAARADPHRRERGLAREGHRREARLAHRGGDGRERRAAHPLPRGRGLPRDQGLAEGARRRDDGAGEPAASRSGSTTRSTSASPRRARSSPAP